MTPARSRSLPQPGQGLVPLAFLLKSSPHVDAGLSHLRVQPERLGIALPGLGGLTQARRALPRL